MRWSMRLAPPAVRFRRARAARKHTCAAATLARFAGGVNDLEHFEEAKSLLRKLMPVTRRALGESHELMLMMRWTYAKALYRDANATLDDLRDAATRLEELAPNTRRVLGDDNPITKGVVRSLQEARAALDARETPSPCQCSVS